MKIWPYFILIVLSSNAFSTEKVISRLYFLHPFGHLHKNASKESSSKTIVQCSHSVKILKAKTKIPGWTYAQVGDDKGYIQSDFLGRVRPKCFQGKYQKFYSKMKLDITEMYYWGRLYDQYLTGRSRAK